jgi:hypothetical protein
VRRRGHLRHRVGVGQHDLHPRLLHRRHLRRTHQPARHVRGVPGVPVRALLYMVAQSLGAICGVALVMGFHSGFYVRYGGGANKVAAGFSTGTVLARRRDHWHLRPRVHRLLCY